MRIPVKGGVWKNTEDEILKAAVMKYGLNQWARISSLLVRKSAKQCKARWYEWLDPAIKKTEWSREEEEKLLHLAKLMPTQWRTIAPIVGRTPAQCLEHYEKLLDAAQMQREGAEEIDPSDDPRRLRPGEIDPTPEAKPARPDPVDMDEDEKEMLSEARARLANTRGKKAKRKAREKQLDEARRLASLQKRRELKAAGLELPQRKRKIKGIDYAKEIPFLKPVPKGFYDSSAEREAERNAKDSPNFVNITLQRLEAKRRDEEEERRRRQDAQKQSKLKQKDLPAYIQQVSKLNDPQALKQRPALKLPDAQITDIELAEMAKMGYTPEDLAAAGASSDDPTTAATKALLSDYSAARGPTPFRTPASRGQQANQLLGGRTPARQDTVLMEAQNLAALTVASTPLLGGENSQLHSTFDDFGGVTPSRSSVQTPNPLATPLHKSSGVSQTPVRGGKVGSAPVSGSATPIRDGLSINSERSGIDPSEQQIVLDPRMERQRQLAAQANLKLGLSSLPKPTNEIKLMLPELPEEEENMNTSDRPEDAADVERRRQAIEQAKQEKKLRMRTEVLKKELPRPLGLTQAFIDDTSSLAEDDDLISAEQLVKKEMLLLLTNDAVEYPVKGVKPPPRTFELEELDEDALNAARALLKEETKSDPASVGIVRALFNRLAAADSTTPESDWLFVPNRKRYVQTSTLKPTSSPADKSDLLAALQYRFDQVKAWNKSESAKAAALEKKLGMYNGGYEARASTLDKEILALHEQLEQATLERLSFESLRVTEQKAVQHRAAKIEAELEEQRVRENTLQVKYANLYQQYEHLSAAAAMATALGDAANYE